MNKFVLPAIIIGFSFILALVSASLTCSVQATSFPNLSGATLSLQATPTPAAKDKSEVGSTDEIVVMGGVIAVVIFAPIFVSRKKWK